MNCDSYTVLFSEANPKWTKLRQSMLLWIRSPRTNSDVPAVFYQICKLYLEILERAPIETLEALLSPHNILLELQRRTMYSEIFLLAALKKRSDLFELSLTARAELKTLFTVDPDSYRLSPMRLWTTLGPNVFSVIHAIWFPNNKDWALHLNKAGQLLALQMVAAERQEQLEMENLLQCVDVLEQLAREVASAANDQSLKEISGAAWLIYGLASNHVSIGRFFWTCARSYLQNYFGARISCAVIDLQRQHEHVLKERDCSFPIRADFCVRLYLDSLEHAYNKDWIRSLVSETDYKAVIVPKKQRMAQILAANTALGASVLEALIDLVVDYGWPIHLLVAF